MAQTNADLDPFFTAVIDFKQILLTLMNNAYDKRKKQLIYKFNKDGERYSFWYCEWV